MLLITFNASWPSGAVSLVIHVLHVLLAVTSQRNQALDTVVHKLSQMHNESHKILEDRLQYSYYKNDTFLSSTELSPPSIII